MSLPLRKRTVHFYEIHLRSYAKGRASIQHPSCAALQDLLKCFAQLATRSKLPQTIRRSPHLHTVLADWNYDQANSCYELLISKANAALSDVALRDLATARLRKAGKTKAEGIEISAHVLVRPNADGRTAAMLLTMQAGVCAKDVVTLLRALSREAAKHRRNRALFHFDVPSGAKDANGKPEQYEVTYGFTAYAHQGQTLANALQSGEFEAMDLIARQRTQFDTGGNLQITERSVSVQATVPKAVTGARIINAVRSFVQSREGAGFDKLRIHYKTVAGKKTSATLNINDLDAAFTLKDHIELDTEVEAQQETLSPIILAGMKPLLQSVPS
ncbi:hypothetical protein SAMN05428957_10871 [Oryzisolibacter propanilivorax]|uniref:Uncharacterized protein n=1 Tax=Oryzisolibacter propanilivorax TaxID=1527607 RepID=A0A1G9UA64_9BURK|nr:hypothetical protein [Oryzisolibacter propanilivorax]SDM56877.1 hypothetical protein SAMN05428957_10871 [Oryzisolibacter propanilivorax]